MNSEVDSKEAEKHSTLHVLKEHLGTEMFTAVLTALDTPHYALKVYLVIFLLLAYGMAVYTSVFLVLGYLDYAVITTTRIVFETPATFPKITICNVNKFTTPFAYELVSSVLSANQSQSKTLNYKIQVNVIIITVIHNF